MLAMAFGLGLAAAILSAVWSLLVRQRPDPSLHVVLAHRGPAPGEAQRRAWMATVDPAQSIYQTASLASLREHQLWQPRLLGLLLRGYATGALALVATGIGGQSRLWANPRRRDQMDAAGRRADGRARSQS